MLVVTLPLTSCLLAILSSHPVGNLIQVHLLPPTQLTQMEHWLLHQAQHLHHCSGFPLLKFALAGCDFACPNSLSCTYDFVGIYTVHICTSCMIHVNLVYIVWTVVLTTCLLVSTDVMAAASPSYAMPSVAATQNVSPSLLTSPGVNTSISGGKLSSPGYGTPIQLPVTRPGIEVLKDMCM